MRLTEKHSEKWDNKYHVVPSLFSENGMKAIDKLGQLEDIEEEYGIDLITLFKLIDAVYVYSYGHKNIIRCSNDGISLYDKSITIYNGTCIMSYPLSEYGKSFALTKEELE